MAKEWERYKSEIHTLYITNGKSLNDVRRILKGRLGFDASVRAYRMKLEEWGIRKNKFAANHRNRVRHHPSLGKSIRSLSSLAPRSSNVASALPADRDTTSFTPGPILQFHNQEAWIPGLHFSANSDGHNYNSRLAALATTVFHENSAAPHVVANEEADFASQDQSLHRAISQGTEEEINILLSSGMPVSTRDGLNNSPLHTAVMRGNINIVKSLLNYGADIDAIGFKQKTPLHLSVGSNSLVQLLLKHQATLSLQDDEGNTVLHHMLLMSNWWEDDDANAILETILTSGGDVNIKNKSAESPLHRLVAGIIPMSLEYMNMVSKFLNCKPNVTSPMRNGSALLAVFLEKSGILSTDNFNVLDRYEECGFRCLEQFLAAGADPNITFRSKPLLICCLTRRLFWVQTSLLLLLLQKTDIDIAGSDGNNPLHLVLAQTFGRWQVFETVIFEATSTLIDRKANINQANAKGEYPLEAWLKQEGYHIARRPFYVKLALLLVKGGAVTTIFTSTGRTLFDLLTYMPQRHRICLIKGFLEAAITSQQDDNSIVPCPDWVEPWRLTWTQPMWHIAKARLRELERANSVKSCKDFKECAFLVIAERLLRRHWSQLMLWQEGDLDKESVRENYEEYCAILIDCRELNAAIDPSWYTNLLDIMDFS